MPARHPVPLAYGVAGGKDAGDAPDRPPAQPAGEARALIAFLADRDPTVYRRYGHWWAKLPPGQTRLLN